MVVFGFVSLTTQAQATILYSQDVVLASGWNIISTPRVLDSHSFSAAETSSNFDIYILNDSGWSTMADLGQTEFTPLYGYFINNKTGVTQTLTLNYKSDAPPNERLFERTFSATGWYSFGVANPSYALSVGSATSTDSNNPSSILSALVTGSSMYDAVVDFTESAASIDSVALSDPWNAAVNTQVNTLRDFREIKGYAIYIKQAGALYNGFQNDSIPQCLDGIDNDNNGSIDYTRDKGCTGLTDNNEYGGVSGALAVIACTQV